MVAINIIDIGTNYANLKKKSLNSFIYFLPPYVYTSSNKTLNPIIEADPIPPSLAFYYVYKEGT